MPDGYLALVLHGHLPYVYHPERDDILEERWVYEALTECYLPLLEVFETLIADGIDFRITLSLSPTLLSMLVDENLQERYYQHLLKTIQLAQQEQERLAKSAELYTVSAFYLDKLSNILNRYEKYSRDIIKPIKLFQQKGCLEVITTCSTHGYLPLMKNQISRRAQVETAVDEYYRLFGCMPKGMWLPECGYAPGVGQILRDCGLKYFFIDTHGIANCTPAPVYGVFAPVCTRTGVAAFARDPESSRQVWDRTEGYPGDPAYREFYRDIGYDLDIDYIGPYLPGGKYRVDTGLKYYRITGKEVDKEPYNPLLADHKAAVHARDFVERRRRQVQEAAAIIDRRPLAVAPYDAELFGHWWFEGPQWINYVCRGIAGGNSLRMITPTDYLMEYPQNQAVDIPMCSWGTGGYNQHWLNTATDWMYKHVHIAEDRMSELADTNPRAAGVEKRCLNQCARELLLAQSSDWPFIVYEGTAVEYAKRRFKDHIGRFNILADMLGSGQYDLDILKEIEARENFLPNIDYRVYCSSKYTNRPPGIKKSYRIMMLSWEYPPMTVGGLARHVHDLACTLSSLGDEVHVITCPAEGRDVFSLDQGVYVHRVHPDRLTAEKFIDWVKQLNEAMLDMSGMLVEVFGSFDLVHAHDWLVGEAAGRISDRFNLPQVATIHATEYGRNQGLHNDLQRHIHGLEYEFAKRSELLICCSNYMKHEIFRLFDCPSSKLRVIPNGVELENIQSGINQISQREDDGKTIVFLGRLVPEKGVQVLISALPAIIRAVGEVRLVIAGKGPYQEELKQLAVEFGVSEQVDFIGFVNDESRNRLLNRATVAVFPSLYEPFGIVALEAMAAGVPVIVSDTGGLRDIIEHGIDGYLSPPGNAEMLSIYVAELIRHPELAKHFSKRARRNVLVKFNWQQIAVETLGVYAEACREGSRKCGITGSN